jgi:hypothetical protein
VSQPGEGSLTINSLQGSGTLYCLAGAYVRAFYDGNWTNFTGTIVFQAFPANGNIGLNSTLGMPNATVFMMTNNPVTEVVFGKTSGNVLPIGALSGGDSSSILCGSGTSGGNGGQPTIYAIGGLNLNTTNGSQFAADAGCGIRKVGTGTLTLTNNNMGFPSQTVVSNGTLFFAPLGTNASGSPINYLTNNNYLVCSAISIVSPGILDLSQVGDTHTLYLGHNSNGQTLSGNGQLNGNLLSIANSNSVVAPGTHTGSTNLFPGKLTINGTATFNGTTFRMCVDPTATPTYDSIASSGTFTLNSGRLVVTNDVNGLGFPGMTTNVFAFFPSSVAVNIGGASGITNIILPALPAGEFWYTNLNGNLVGFPTVTTAGSMVIVNTNVAVNLNAYPPSIQSTVSGSTLTLGWPTNLGWILQAQTNSANVGLTPTNNWVDVPGSASLTQAVITVNQTNPAVFYRMRNPTAPVQ